jgi:fatty-acid desaturase
MHHCLIHQSYECPKWLEYLFVHFGVIVGLASPFGMVRTHDTRDWAQRQSECHPYFSHQSYFLKDGFGKYMAILF